MLILITIWQEVMQEVVDRICFECWIKWFNMKMWFIVNGSDTMLALAMAMIGVLMFILISMQADIAVARAMREEEVRGESGPLI